jgi:hypothetical protein
VPIVVRCRSRVGETRKSIGPRYVKPTIICFGQCNEPAKIIPEVVTSLVRIVSLANFPQSRSEHSLFHSTASQICVNRRAGCHEISLTFIQREAAGSTLWMMEDRERMV